jgi:hypothetical protein
MQPWRETVVLGVAASLAVAMPTFGQKPAAEEFRYVQAAKSGFADAAEIRVARHERGWSITSQTGGGAARMVVEAAYDADDRLTAARAAQKEQAVAVKVKDGKATVERAGQKPAAFDVPPGTIVTSAPDWTDVFLLCRRYDRKRGGKQEHPALWIHPTQPPQRLTFSIERTGEDAIEHDGKKVALERYTIRIRGGSAYAAWADAEGRMVRLVPLPQRAATAGLTLKGYEKSAAGLRAP